MTKAFAGKRVLISITAIAIAAIALGGTYYFKQKEELNKKVLSHIELGHSHFIKGEIAKAYEQYQKAWSLKPKVTSPVERNAAVNLAQIMIAKGDTAGAQGLLLKTLQYDPFFYPSYLFLGDIYLRAKDADKALFYFEKGLSLKEHFIKEDPNAALLYYNMAEALLLKGDRAGARRHLETFLSMAGKDKRLEGIVAKARGTLGKMKS